MPNEQNAHSVTTTQNYTGQIRTRPDTERMLSEDPITGKRKPSRRRQQQAVAKELNGAEEEKSAKDEKSAKQIAAQSADDDYGWDEFEDPDDLGPILSRKETATKAMLDQIPDDADENDRLARCCGIAAAEFEYQLSAYEDLVAFEDDLWFSDPVEAIQKYMRLRPFSRVIESLEIIQGLERARQRRELWEVAAGIGMNTPSQLIGTPGQADELISGVIPAGRVGTLSAAKNRLKTKIALDLSISLASGTKFLNHFPIARRIRTGIIAGEDYDDDIYDAIDRICRSKAIDIKSLDGHLFVATKVPRLCSKKWLTAMRQFIELSRLEYLCVEAGYMGLGGADQRSLQAMGDALSPIKKLCDDTGCAIQLSLHHKHASSSRFPILDDISGVGFEELARYWLLANSRREWDPTTGQHRLRLVIGNKRSENRYHLDVREGHVDGPGGRCWDVKVREAAAGDATVELERPSVRKPRAPQPLVSYTDSVMKVLEQHPEGLSMTALGKQAGIPEKQRKKVLDAIVAAGQIKPATVSVGNQKTPREGYKLR